MSDNKIAEGKCKILIHVYSMENSENEHNEDDDTWNSAWDGEIDQIFPSMPAHHPTSSKPSISSLT